MITLASAQSHPRTPSQVCGHGHQGGCAVDHDSNPSKEWLRSKAAWFQNGRPRWVWRALVRQHRPSGQRFLSYIRLVRAGFT
jgi:hypothetical protein